jgi:antitoxin YefM
LSSAIAVSASETTPATTAGSKLGAASEQRGLLRGLASGTISRTSQEERWVVVVTASDARRNLFPLIEQVNNDRQPVEITSKRGDAVLMARADYDALEATAYLLRVPANAKKLLESLEQARAGDRQTHDLA